MLDPCIDYYALEHENLISYSNNNNADATFFLDGHSNEFYAPLKENIFSMIIHWVRITGMIYIFGY